MAMTFGVATTSQGISTGSGAWKTILLIAAPANTALRLIQSKISFNGTSPTGGKIRVRIARSATGGTGTNVTPAKVNASDAETLQTTAKENFSGEPSGGTTVIESYVHPQSGEEFRLNLKVKAGETVAIQVNAPSAVDAVAMMQFEE